jgi:hypothetical protein
MAQLSSNRVLVLATNTACIECTPNDGLKFKLRYFRLRPPKN